MASITIDPTQGRFHNTSDVTGDEKILVINKGGKPSTIKVNQILDKIDDEIVDRIDDQVIEKVENQIEEKIDEIIDERLENIDPNNNLTWNEVL